MPRLHMQAPAPAPAPAPVPAPAATPAAAAAAIRTRPVHEHILERVGRLVSEPGSALAHAAGLNLNLTLTQQRVRFGLVQSSAASLFCAVKKVTDGCYHRRRQCVKNFFHQLD